MISRVADHCFWLGRYLERAESIARVLSVTQTLALDAELTARQCWQPVIIVSGELEPFAVRFGPDASGDGELVQRYMTWDEQNLSSILRSLQGARENARSIREVVSLETWEVLNELYLWLSGPRAREDFARERFLFYRRVRNSVQLCLGYLRSTMLHDTPLDFIWLGVLMERVGQTSRILDVHHHAMTSMELHRVVQTALWLSILRACSGFEPFMKRSQGRVTRDGVAAFLILEPQFPRSVRYCVRYAYQTLAAIRPPSERSLPGGHALERLRVLDSWLAEMRPTALEAGSVHELLTHVVDETAGICNDIGRELLGYGGAAAPQAAAT